MTSKKYTHLSLILVGLILTACCPQAVQPTPTAVTPAPTGVMQEPTSEPTAEPTSGEPTDMALADPPEAAAAAEQALSAALDIPVDEIEIVSYERRDWPDACLGLAGEGEMCAQVITPGWRIVLRVQDEQHVYHTDESGSMVRPEDPGDMLGGGDPQILARGEFEGAAGHRGSGTATIVPLPDGGALLRLEDFSVTPGPDLYVYLVSAADPASRSDFGDFVDLGLLQEAAGNQSYMIPPEIDVEQYQGVVIYCLAYEVLFATAALE